MLICLLVKKIFSFKSISYGRWVCPLFFFFNFLIAPNLSNVFLVSSFSLSFFQINFFFLNHSLLLLSQSSLHSVLTRCSTRHKLCHTLCHINHAVHILTEFLSQSQFIRLIVFSSFWVACSMGHYMSVRPSVINVFTFYAIFRRLYEHPEHE